MNFEQAMEKLEEITQSLEEGNLPLEKSLKKFEEGMGLINFCEKKLEEVEKRIRILVKEENKLKMEEVESEEKQGKGKGKGKPRRKTENGLLFNQNNQK